MVAGGVDAVQSVRGIYIFLNADSTDETDETDLQHVYNLPSDSDS